MIDLTARMEDGSLFHADGAATEKALLPKLVRERGTSNCPDVNERSRDRFSRVESGTSISEM